MAGPYVLELANRLTEFADVGDLDELSADDLADLMLTLANAANQIEAEAAQLALLAERRGVGLHRGSKSTGAFLAHRTNGSRTHCHRLIRAAETESVFLAFLEARCEGAITRWHIDHLGQTWRQNRHLESLLHRDQHLLVDAARSLPPDEFGLVCRKWLAMADPDGAYEKFLRQQERRFLASRRDLEGNLHLVGRMDPIQGEEFLNLLDQRVQELFDLDWAAAKASQEAAGGEVDPESLTRVLPRNDRQRRMDALVSLVLDGSALPEGAQRPEPSIQYGVDHETWQSELARTMDADLARHGLGNDADASSESDTSGSGRPTEDPPPSTAAAFDPMRRCETASGQPVPFRVLLEASLHATVRRVVFGAPSVVIDAGHLRRFFDGPQREIIEYRDRCCTFPGCHQRAAFCEIDHILAVTQGGRTDLTNGQCLCRHHHRLKSRGRFRCERAPDGTVQFFLPDGVPIE